MLRRRTVEQRSLLPRCDGDDMEEIFDEVPFDSEGFVSFRSSAGRGTLPP